MGNKDYLPSVGSIKVYLEVTYPAINTYAYSDFKVITYSDSSKTFKILENTHSTVSGSSFSVIGDDITSYGTDLIDCYGSFSANDNEDDIADLYLYFKTTVDQSL